MTITHILNQGYYRKNQYTYLFKDSKGVLKDIRELYGKFYYDPEGENIEITDKEHLQLLTKN